MKQITIIENEAGVSFNSTGFTDQEIIAWFEVYKQVVVDHLSESIKKAEITAKPNLETANKPKKETKTDSKKQAKNLSLEGSELIKAKKYQEALDKFTEANIIHPDNKFILADIKRCHQWIEAVAKLKEKEDYEKDALSRQLDLEIEANRLQKEQEDDLNFEFPE